MPYPNNQSFVQSLYGFVCTNNCVLVFEKDWNLELKPVAYIKFNEFSQV